LNKRVLVLGGYGVFGSRVAAGLVSAGWDVVVAGRSLAAAQAHCAEHSGTPVMLDREAADFAAQVADLAPFAIVDAAGPFQAYARPLVVEVALASGAHLLDLSDDAGFTAGIAAFDAQARAAGITILSGVSTVPALSSAVVTDLVQGMTDVHLIESVILPGNRAPRGLSVIKAILAQVGRPVAIWREGPATEVGWGRAEPDAVSGAFQGAECDVSGGARAFHHASGVGRTWLVGALALGQNAGAAGKCLATGGEPAQTVRHR
jgi:saccharopine dehydrogenase-like NADP-dependent oxidoreductase